MYNLAFYVLLGLNLTLTSGLHIIVLTYGISSKATSASNAIGYIAPAVDLGIKELRLLYGFNVTYVVLTRPDILTCDDELMNVDLVSNYYYNHIDLNSLFVIISAGCETTIPLSRLSREWNTLIIACGGSFPEVRNKSLHPTAVAMTTLSFKLYRQGLVAMLITFAWSKVVLIHDTVAWYPFYKLLAKELQLSAPEFADRLSITPFPINSSGNISYASLLLQANRITRVIILGCHATQIRTFMVVASQLGMTDYNYVYFALEPFPNWRGFGNILLELNNSDDQVAFDAYQQIFQMSTCTREKTEQMQLTLQQIKETAVRDYNASYFPMEQPTEISVLAYFAVKAFSQVLSETFYSSESVYDAVSMAKHFRNRTFIFDVGSVYVDSSGEHLPDYCFKRFSKFSKSFEDVLRFNQTSNTVDTVGGINLTAIWNTPDGNAPPNVPLCGFSGKLGHCKQESDSSTLYSTAIISVLLISFGASVIAYRISKAAIALRDEWWRIQKTDLLYTNSTADTSSFMISTKKFISMSSLIQYNRIQNVQTAFLNGAPVQTEVFRIQNSFSPGNKARKALSELKNLTHRNIVRLLGLHVDFGILTVVYECCQKGDLADVLERLQLDWYNRISLLSDIIEGLHAIYASYFKRHGYISPYTLFINNRLTLQIGDVGIFDIFCNTVTVADTDKGLLVSETQSRWTAPELQKFLPHLPNLYLISHHASPEADIYSLGAVIMFMNEDCERSENSGLNYIFILARACLAGRMSDRPNITKVRENFRTTFPRATDVMQNLITRMETYAQKLEAAVSERTEALLEERRLCEELLAEMMPRVVVSKLLRGQIMEAESFDCVTVMFSYIIGFLDFVSQRTDNPEKVVTFLNQIFTTFDRLLAQYDIYKVETISDTYMAVSGLPEPNGDKHALEICKLSSQLRDSFELATELTQPKLQIAIGIHSGPCAAGVVGNKRPRYCLFGDTVNTASRLATQGLPSMIHISCTTATLIKNNENMKAISRGVVNLKGKGKETTFWLKLKATEDLRPIGLPD